MDPIPDQIRGKTQGARYPPKSGLESSKDRAPGVGIEQGHGDPARNNRWRATELLFGTTGGSVATPEYNFGAAFGLPRTPPESDRPSPA